MSSAKIPATSVFPAKMSEAEIKGKVDEAVKFSTEGKSREALNELYDVSKSILSFKQASKETIVLLRPDVITVLIKALVDGLDIEDTPEVFWAFGITDLERSVMNVMSLKYLQRGKESTATDLQQRTTAEQ